MEQNLSQAIAQWNVTGAAVHVGLVWSLVTNGDAT
jgi:hypothetical protein